ncbi:hypothetical protein BJ741DRAFT_137221 [Chytriomyces cf. hyalinus JEL632]|nr:hypothetical protein BJ741DRAFT_137221 [Chytriomyces cf. hyalinus JEL632]
MDPASIWANMHSKWLCANANPEALKLAVVYPNIGLDETCRTRISFYTQSDPTWLQFLLKQTLVISEFGAITDLTHLIETATQDTRTLSNNCSPMAGQTPTVNEGAPLREAASIVNAAPVALLLQDTRVHPNPSFRLIKTIHFRRQTRHAHRRSCGNYFLADPRTDLSLPNWSMLVRAVHDRASWDCKTSMPVWIQRQTRALRCVLHVRFRIHMRSL